MNRPATDRDLTQKIAVSPLSWTASVAAARRAEKWFMSSAWPRFMRWWTPQTQGMKLAMIGVAILVFVSMVNLLSVTLFRSGERAGVPVEAGTVASSVTLKQEAAPSDAGKAWSVVRVWQGNASRETEEFTVTDHWRVDWIFSPTHSGASFQVYIYRADGRLLLQQAANTVGGSDTTFWFGPGKYFLRVNSSEGDWKLDVQDLR
jgi:hypothetical protein